jgi:transcriptional regulator with XRE-family HTH domain
MKEKSLRQLANELGISASYLSQIRSGKKKPNSDLLTKIPFEALTKHKVLTKRLILHHKSRLIFPCANRIILSIVPR